MPKYVLTYRGGVPDNPKAAAISLAKWQRWFGDLSASVVDRGSPTRTGKAISGSGKIAVEAHPISGYSIIKADTLDTAIKLIKECPIYEEGGQVEIAELIEL